MCELFELFMIKLKIVSNYSVIEIKKVLLENWCDRMGRFHLFEPSPKIEPSTM